MQHSIYPNIIDFTVVMEAELSRHINSLIPGISERDFKNAIFNHVLLFGIFRSSHDNVLRWMPHDLTADTSTLVQVMAWRRQATSHHVSQCPPSSLSPYGVARPQWVNETTGRLWRYHYLRDKTAEKYDNDGKADTSGWWNATMNFNTKYITFWHQEIAFRQRNVVREVSFIFEKEKYDITTNTKIIVGVWFFFWDTRF